MSLLIERNFVFIGTCQWPQTDNYLGFPKGESKVKNALRYFYYFFCFCVQSQIAIWALKRMRACLIRGQGIDLQGFNQYGMQSLGSFHCIPPQASFVKLADWYALALLAKNCLFAQNSEMKVRTFVRIQRVIWDHYFAGF